MVFMLVWLFRYLDFLESTIVPLTLDTFQVSSSYSLGILGSSLGGLISCYAGWTRTTYDHIGCMSSSFWWNNTDYISAVIPSANPAVHPKFYLDSGSKGGEIQIMGLTIQVRDIMEADPYDYTLDSDIYYYLDVGGEHSETYWGARFWIPMTDLYGV